MCIYRTWGNSNEERETKRQGEKGLLAQGAHEMREWAGRIIHALDKKKKKKKKKLPSKKHTF